jgi:hypothetical protein
MEHTAPWKAAGRRPDVFPHQSIEPYVGTWVRPKWSPIRSEQALKSLASIACHPPPVEVSSQFFAKPTLCSSERPEPRFGSQKPIPRPSSTGRFLGEMMSVDEAEVGL